MKVMCAMGLHLDTSISYFEVQAEKRAGEKERLHNRRKGKEMKMNGKRNNRKNKKKPKKVKGRDAGSVSRGNQEQRNDRNGKA